MVRAKSIRAAVIAFATAMVANCARPQWTVVDAFLLGTDTGVELDLTLDPLAVVEKQVRKAVENCDDVMS